MCKTTLLEAPRYFHCLQNHTFDKSREGYINLLLANMKHSKDPGDNKQMIKSRANFLNKGHYAAISQLLNSYVQGKLISTPGPIIDIGCGNGYYLRNLKNDFASASTYVGLDISKEAIKIAAKEEKNITWIVSNISQLPFQENSLHGIISIFSPQNFSEFNRIINDEGYLFMISPATHHLYELRERLFDDIKNIANDRFLQNTRDDFVVDESIPLQYSIHLSSNEDITNLFSMTPYYWRCSAEKRLEILSLSSLSLTIDVVLWIFRKKP